jgi:hypothetical protein
VTWRRRLAELLVPPPIESAGGIPFSDLYPSRGGTGLRQRSYAPVRSVASSTNSVAIADANPARRSLSIVNDSTADLYLSHGPLASPSGYTVKLGPGATYALEEPGIYRGELAGAWSAVNGSARVTEGT